MKKVHIEFDYRGRHYFGVVRVRQKPQGREFLITVLDWKLERILYGHHIIREADGVLAVNALRENREQTELKLTIAARLAAHLKVPCFVGDERLSTTPCQRTWEYFHALPGHERGGPY